MVTVASCLPLGGIVNSDEPRSFGSLKVCDESGFILNSKELAAKMCALCFYMQLYYVGSLLYICKSNFIVQLKVLAEGQL